jgi:hypothetical protein
MVKGWPVYLREEIVSSPALGDVDGDRSTLEIVIGTKYGSVYVLKSDGSTMDGWPVSVMDIMNSSPALGDIDGDGDIEIIVATSTGQHYIGLVYAFSITGKRLGAMWPVFTEGNICYSSPALGDLDGDADLELVVGSCRLANGAGGQVHAWDLAGRSTAGEIPWSGFRHDSRHTGVAGDIAPPSFVIAVLQNAALRKYLSLYIVASEQLITAPELTVVSGLELPVLAEEAQDAALSIPLTQIDALAHIYEADFTVESDIAYTFTVSGTDISGNTGHSSKSIRIHPHEQIPNLQPARFALLPNYPNPFNPGTWIPYELARQEHITIEIHNAAGQLIRSLDFGPRAAGSYTSRDTAAYWDGTDNSAQEVATGVYFCILKAGDFRAIRKMILLK